MLDSNKNKKKSNRIEALIKNKWFILLCNVCYFEYCFNFRFKQQHL